MPGKPKTALNPAALRSRAEKLAGKPAAAHADADTRRLLHELEVHQIELEMQNTELRRSRDESEALLEKYTELYDFAPVGYFTLSAEGTIRLANLTGAGMVGTERSNLIGRSFAMLLAHMQRAGFKAWLARVFETETKHSGEFELADTKAGGRIVVIDARRNTDGSECSATVKDVTARRLAQEQMRVSENRYRRLFEAAHDGVLLVDPETNRIIDANPFISRLLKYSREQLVGKELFEIGLLNDEAASRRMFRELKRSHEVRYENLPMRSRTGSHKDVEVVANLYQEDGHPMIQLNIRDITERKLAEAMARRNMSLEQAIVRKGKIEEDLLAQRNEQSRVLRHARAQQKQMRDLSHRILNAQEEERKRISRELHDVIAQTLVGINVHLTVLNKGSAAPPAAFRRQLAKTQSLVAKAVGIVHDFARQLRPTMLDDLGLIPTLHMHMERFMADTGIRVSLKASAKINESATTGLTVLYRIALEALTNVARHSKASRVDVTIESLEEAIRMTIRDDGRGFQVIGKAGSRKKNRLGLIGMRERAEMLGGSFEVDSAPGGPTTVRVEIPAR
jgi:PAS domain S-box-containing protein